MSKEMIHRSVALAKQVELFFASELGQYIEELAEEEVMSAGDRLATVDPTDVKEIMKLQNIISRHICFKQWMMNLVMQGDLAYQEHLENEE